MTTTGRLLRDWLSVGGAAWPGAALMALLPAAVRLWQTRVLVRRANDPALPERLLAANRGVGYVLGVAIALIVLSWTAEAVWALPLMIAARLAAAYPLRKALYDETWGLGSFLWFFLRLLVASAGFWILLALTPALASRPGPSGWVVAAALAALLLAWNEFHARIFRRLLRARPVDDPEIVARFARLVAATGLPEPRFERVDLDGGVFANAIALPSLRGSAVLVSETLLERFDRDEVAAVCAHELAHLEHYDRRRLGRLGHLSRGLVVLGALWSPLLRMVSPAAPWAAFWPAVVVVTLVVLARRRQRHETASDLRALALTGDADALVRALTRLHAIAHVPRRWDAELERRASHPSLARRIQAIRTAAGQAPAAIGDVSFDAPGGAASATFHDDHLSWTERGRAPRTLRYGELVELRVEARWRGDARLLAVDQAGRRWRLPLAGNEIARVQAVLDTVDARLASGVPRSRVPVILSRLVAGLSAVIALVGPQISAVVLGLAALLVPAAPLVAAAGAAALVSAGLTWRDAEFATRETRAAPVLLIFGLLLLGLAVWRRHEEHGPWSRRLTVGLAVAGALSTGVLVLGGVLLAGRDAIGFHAMARAWPETALLPIAFAAAAIGRRSTRARMATAAGLVVGLFAVSAGTAPFLDAFSADPLLLSAEPVREPATWGKPDFEFVAPFDVIGLRVSPHGRAVALVSEDRDERTTFHVGDVDGALAPFAADDAQFIDDRRLLLVEQQPDGTLLREIALDPEATPVWEQRVPDMAWGELSLDPDGRRWSLLGRTRDSSVLVARGSLRDPAIESQRWDRPDSGDRLGRPIATTGSAALVLETDYRPGLLTHGIWRRLIHRGPLGLVESRFVRLGPGGATVVGVSHLNVDCQPSPILGESSICAVFDGSRTRIVALDAGARLFQPLVSLPGHLFVDTYSGSGRLTGWWNGGSVVLQLETREALRLSAADDENVVRLVAARQALAALAFDGERSTVRVYGRAGGDRR